MDLHVDDDAFVRAPTPLVYRRLTDLGGWPEWWPGVRTVARPTPDDSERWAVLLERSARRRLALNVRAHAWRHDAGFRLDLAGDLEGWAEFWLEPGWSGTVVHHVMVASTGSSRPLKVLEDYRAVLRRGLWGLKDDLQTDVRRAVGMTP